MHCPEILSCCLSRCVFPGSDWRHVCSMQGEVVHSAQSFTESVKYPYLSLTPLLEAFQIAVSFLHCYLLLHQQKADASLFHTLSLTTRQYYVKFYNCNVVVHSSR